MCFTAALDFRIVRNNTNDTATSDAAASEEVVEGRLDAALDRKGRIPRLPDVPQPGGDRANLPDLGIFGGNFGADQPEGPDQPFSPPSSGRGGENDPCKYQI